MQPAHQGLCDLASDSRRLRAAVCGGGRGISELRDQRLDQLEEDVRDMRATLAALGPLITRIDERLNTELPHLRTEMSHLATKAEVVNCPPAVTCGG
jgi:hypothetical protein